MLVLLPSLVDRIGGHFMSLRRYSGGFEFSHDGMSDAKEETSVLDKQIFGYLSYTWMIKQCRCQGSVESCWVHFSRKKIA